jgi:hypothetical protein
MTVPQDIEAKILTEAKRKNMLPADLVEKIIEAVFGDGIVDAVLDER